MSAVVVRGNASCLPLADNTVDLVVTSPPYFALRSYTDGGGHYAGQVGAEATPAEFVNALIDVTRECMRVLKPSGSLWVNLGDKYASYEGNRGAGRMQDNGPRGQRLHGSGLTGGGFVRSKSLMGLPWRYALRCIDELGLILRAEVIWSKPNGLPESVTDRVRRSHEQWFHFTQEPRYYSAVDEIREPHLTPGIGGPRRLSGAAFSPDGRTHSADGSRHTDGNPLGKLPGSVWTSSTQGDTVARSVLQAVAAGALGVEEGERILWSIGRSSGAESTSQATAGSGQDCSTARVTGDTTRSTTRQDEHTGSPTRWSEDRSLQASGSTTCAGRGDASDPSTSSPSPSKATSPDDPSQMPVPLDTTTTSRTRTSGQTASESAEPASATDSGFDGPPSVWVIPTQPLQVPAGLGVDHFAAFPMEWPRRIIRGWSPSGICTECGEGRRPVKAHAPWWAAYKEANGIGDYLSGSYTPGEGYDPTAGRQRASNGASIPTGPKTVITGYDCACATPDAPTRPAVVLDPFGGTGTTALVADTLGRTGISVDLSHDYSRLARWRTTDRGERARAMQVDKPAPEIDGQADLFGGAA